MSNATSSTGAKPVYTTAKPVVSGNISQKELHATIIALNYFLSTTPVTKPEDPPDTAALLADLMANAAAAKDKLKAMLEGAGR